MTDGGGLNFFLIKLQELEYIGLIGLGKIAEPQSGEMSVDLEKTKYSIGVLEMLEEKTKGNLNEMEQQELMRVLTSLRINFVESAKNADATTPPPAPPHTS
jgi:Domain of unknown function (DUF1844)